jgi:alginate O-acetyltransferase complex protein AlgI
VLFTEARFALLVVVSWIAWANAPRRLRPAVLAASGAVFYAWYAPGSALLVFVLILVVYLPAPRFWMLSAAIALSVLGYYKLLPAGLLPVGLSFLTFELVSFAIDRGRGRTGDASFVDYLAFALFFPCRVAGPIKRLEAFRKAVAVATVSPANVYAGVVRVLVGVAKKVVLADSLGLTVDELAYAATPMHALKILLAYSAQIYLDFSAYSDMAIGVSRIFGVEIPENFNWPYLSDNIQEFWTRWHISLSSWVRDYIFMPVGARAFASPLRQRPMAIASLSYLASFVVVGAWHGLTANFLVWGLYHGVLLSGHHVYRRTVAARLATHPFYQTFYQSGAVRAASIGVTFAFVTAGWILFMTPDLARAAHLVKLIVGLA